jgi:hypothetical protein
VRRSHRIGALGLLAVVAALFFCVPRTADPGVSGTVSLERVGHDHAYVTVRLQPADAAEGARWFEATAWQGGGFVTGPMVEVAEDVYRSSEPLPIHGKWKAMLRLHQGQRDLRALWVYAPADAEIGKPEIPAVDGESREFVHEQQVLRREERTDVPSWMWNGGYLVLALAGSLEIGGIVWLVARAAHGGRIRVSRRIENVDQLETIR